MLRLLPLHIDGPCYVVFPQDLKSSSICTNVFFTALRMPAIAAKCVRRGNVSHLQWKCALGRCGAARLLHVRSHAMQEATSTLESMELSQAQVKARVSNQVFFSNKQNTFDHLGSHDACGSQNHSTAFDCRVTCMHTQMRIMCPSACECAFTLSDLSLGHGLRRKGCPFQSTDASDVCAHMRAF